MNREEVTGIIFDIKRYAVHDGPGIRTTVFLKGCPLTCIWCHNPEAISLSPELVVHPEKCIICGACLEQCPLKAHETTVNGERIFHRERCEACGKCVEVCYAEALTMYGKNVSVEEVMDEIRKDAEFYRNSGGGVTVSGGEPLVQHQFIMELLKQCKQEGFHTALDTCGYARWEALESCLPYLDLVLYDLKHIDAILHKNYTGVPNTRILVNLRKLDHYAVPIEIRIPVVPGINDSREVIEDIARFLQPMKNINGVRLLPFHRYADSKYMHLGRKNTMPDVDVPDMARLREIAAWMHEYDVNVIVV